MLFLQRLPAAGSRLSQKSSHRLYLQVAALLCLICCRIRNNFGNMYEMATEILSDLSPPSGASPHLLAGRFPLPRLRGSVNGIYWQVGRAIVLLNAKPR